MSDLPHTTAEAFENWATSLSNNSAKQTEVMKFFKLLVGDKLQDSVARILRATVTDDVLSQFTFRGKMIKGQRKKSFYDLNLTNIIASWLNLFFSF